MLEGLALGGIFLGCLARSLIPFLKKRANAVEQGINFRWESRYIWTIFLALATSMVTAILLLPTFNIPETSVFPIAFTFGWAAQDIMNRMAK